MGQAGRLDYFRVQAPIFRLFLLLSNEPLSQAATYLSNLNGVLLPSVENVSFACADYLSNSRQTMKR